jgi:UDP-N-acetylmuramoyl-tripeptide--D-alanyl-D-alanine ligase
MNPIEKLYQIYLKYPHVFTDSRMASGGGIFFALKGDNFDGNDFVESALKSGADVAVADRKTFAGNQNVFLVDDVLVALQQLANVHRRQFQKPLLAITGTNGKTTTKELITHVLAEKYNVLSTQGNLNNHIGVPLTLLKMAPEHEFFVVEMGANHPGEIEFLCNIAEPDYGIITNVGRAHLEGFGSFEGVKKTKGELYKFISKAGKGLFINSGNDHLMGMVTANTELFTYAAAGTDAQLIGEVANHDILLVCKVLFPKGWLYIKSNLTGAYNLENVLAACRIGLQFGVDPLLIQKGIEGYVPSNNRSQTMKLGNTMAIADCYNANPSSMEASIRNFLQIDKANKVMILGDMLELGDDAESEHQKIADLVTHSGVSDVFWVGKNFYNSTHPNSVMKYLNVDDLIKNIEKHYFDGKFILIKGSRGIKLEKVLEILK